LAGVAFGIITGRIAEMRQNFLVENGFVMPFAIQPAISSQVMPLSYMKLNEYTMQRQKESLCDTANNIKKFMHTEEMQKGASRKKFSENESSPG
jgi:hypothetical protein